MQRINIRIKIPWIVTGSVMGSLIAIFIEIIKKNPWFLLYQSFVLGWLLVLTAIMVENIKNKRK